MNLYPQSHNDGLYLNSIAAQKILRQSIQKPQAQKNNSLFDIKIIRRKNQPRRSTRIIIIQNLEDLDFHNQITQNQKNTFNNHFKSENKEKRRISNSETITRNINLKKTQTKTEKEGIIKNNKIRSNVIDIKEKQKVEKCQARRRKAKSATLYQNNLNDRANVAIISTEFQDKLKKKHNKSKNLSSFKQIHILKQRLKDQLIINFFAPIQKKLANFEDINSSLISSSHSIRTLPKKNNFNFPTEQSVLQIDQIRQFELKQPIQEKNHHEKSSRNYQIQSTEFIVNNYIKLLRQSKINSSCQKNDKQVTCENYKQNQPIPITEIETGEQQFNEYNLHITENQRQIYIPNSIMLQKSRQITALNELIYKLEKTQQLPNPNSSIIQEVQLFMESRSRSNPIRTKTPGPVEEKISIKSLEKNLRQRQRYLRQRKQKQLQLLKDTIGKVKNRNYQLQKEQILKWTDQQLEQIKSTRKILRKSLRMLKNVNLKPDFTFYPHTSQFEILKCLSESKLDRSFSMKQELRRDYKNIRKVVQTEDELDEQQWRKLAKYQQDSLSTAANKEIRFQRNERQLIRQRPQQQKTRIYQPQRQFNQANLVCQVAESSQQEFQLQPEASSNLHRIYSLEQKQDIFEFIFLDLCIEIHDEYHTSSPIMTKILTFIRNESSRSMRQKGFKTSPASVKQYLNLLINHLKTDDASLFDIFINLDEPLGPSTSDILRYMRSSEPSYEDQQTQVPSIMNVKLFDSFQSIFLSSLKLSAYYTNEEQQRRRKQFVKNAIHIHNKAIFDSFNENLDKHRIFGIWGKPFSWNAEPKFQHERTREEKQVRFKLIQRVFMRSAQRTIQDSSFMCGLIIDKEDTILQISPSLTESYIQQIKEDRLTKMLEIEMLENEEKMLFYNDQQAEILVELAERFLTILLLETCTDIKKLF